MVRIGLSLLLAFALLSAGLSARAAGEPADPRLADHMLGDAKAPVSIDEYFSLGCPHCADFDLEMLPKLKADYIDKGKLKITLHDFPLNEISLQAAMLARCAPNDRYFPMVDTLFRVQQGWAAQRSDQAQLDGLKQQAKFAGMTDSQIDACLTDRALEEGLLKARLNAQNNVQINATPTLILNGDLKTRIEGVPSYDALKAKIDALLKS